MKALGKVFKYGDNVDTDVIIPARYLNSSDPAELATHCMEDIDKDFVNQVKKGDIIVAEKNFGCGSSREHAPISIKASGVSCVIAATFARISTATPLTSDFRLLSAKRHLSALKPVMKWKLILTAVSLQIRQRVSPTKARHSLSLCRKSSRQKV